MIAGQVDLLQATREDLYQASQAEMALAYAAIDQLESMFH